MTRLLRRVLLAGAIVAAALPAGGATAPSAAFQFKWPWRWGTSAGATTPPFQQEHGCYGIVATHPAWPYERVAAYDLNIANDAVASATQGAVTNVKTGVIGCGSGLGFGNFVEVGAVLYAHLASLAAGLGVDTPVLQGDAIGTQGATGNVLPCDPTLNPPDQRGKHLHWKFSDAPYGGALPTIDNGSASSSNSLIGDSSAAGATLRASYIARGGWNTIGWTHKHCPGTCTLDMTANRAWGQMQDFRHDPDIFGGTFNTLHVSNYDPARAYLVDSVFWQAWAVGDAGRAIGMAVGDRGPCPAAFSAACISYQPFYLGFVWMDTFTGRSAVFCPDVDGDGLITITDLAIEGSYFLRPVTPPALDTDGDGLITITDLGMIGDVFLRDCRR